MIRSEAGRDGTMGPWDHGAMERQGAGRAERAGMHWDPLSQLIGSKAVKPWEPWGGMGPWSHGAMSH